MKKTKKRALYVFAALLAAVFVLACMAGFAACGGGSKDDCDTNGHTWDAGVETTAATCTTAGVKTYTCTVCGETKTETIAALGHSYETVYIEADEENEVEAHWALVCSVCGDEQEIEDAGDLSFAVEDEEELVSAIALGGEVALADDITLSDALEIEADAELDLAGNSLSTSETLSSATNTIEVASGATLTITDSGTGTTSGSIKNTYTGATSTDNAAAIAVAEGGTLVIESGTISSTSVGVRAEGVDSDVENTRATVTISGGTIESTYFSIWASGDADVTISGGTISGTSKGICIGGDSNFGYSTYQEGVTTLTITGGTISCTNDSAICTLGVGSADSAVITISGGTITGAKELTYTDEDKTTVKTTYPAVYIPSGTLYISGTASITGITAVEIRGGTASITGGTLAVYDDITTKGVITNSSGATSYGYQLCVNPYGVTNRAELGDYSDKISVTVSSSLLTSGDGGTTYSGLYVWTGGAQDTTTTPGSIVISKSATSNDD